MLKKIGGGMEGNLGGVERINTRAPGTKERAASAHWPGGRETHGL